MATATAKKSAKAGPAKKTGTAKTTSPGKKKAAPKYGPAAAESVRENVEEMHAGKLRSGRSGKKVTNPKQAIAIGLAEARKRGAKLPEPPARAKD
jgi:hypothetical protein